jgi:hypothetical protein
MFASTVLQYSSPGVREPSARGSRKSWTGLGPQLQAVGPSLGPVTDPYLPLKSSRKNTPIFGPPVLN